MLGKETIDTNTYGRSYGSHGSYSTNDQIAGRELLTPDEVRLLDNDYAILFIRGERPIKDFKFDLLKHPNISLTTDGGSKAYIHGNSENAIATVELGGYIGEESKIDIKEFEDRYEILSSEELDEFFLKGNDLNEKERKENI